MPAASSAAAVAAADTELGQLLEEREATQQAATRASNERNQANDLSHLYGREAARLRLGEAEDAQAEAEHVASAAEASVQAWEVLPKLARLAGLRANLVQARTEAAAEERDLALLRAEHAGHASRLRHRLAALARAADDKAETADAAGPAAAQQAENHKASADRAREEEREASSAATAARTRLEVLDSRRRRGVELRHLPTLTTPSADHRDIVAGVREGLAGELAEVEEQTGDGGRSGPPFRARRYGSSRSGTMLTRS